LYDGPEASHTHGFGLGAILRLEGASADSDSLNSGLIQGLICCGLHGCRNLGVASIMSAHTRLTELQVSEAP
jgi:hypothetical protein